MSTLQLLAVIWTHFVADFVLQSDRMAKGKSSSNAVLLQHCAVYGACFLWVTWQYALINAGAHFAVDWVTSRWATSLYKGNKRHQFFVVIGLDQAIHLTTLAMSWA